MNFSIIIPLYNEEKNIENLIREIFSSIPSVYEYEVIMIDDFSEDNTLDIINKIKKKFKNKIKILNNKKNIGQSLSMIKGIKNSSYENILTIDGDGQNNPADIPKLLNIYFSDKGYDLVGGIRKKRKDNVIKIISSKLANTIRRFTLKDNCADTGCSLKIFDKKTFLKFPEFRGIHRFLPALFSGFEKKTFFVNVSHRKRIYGTSNYGTIKRLYWGISDMLKVYRIIKKKK